MENDVIDLSKYIRAIKSNKWWVLVSLVIFGAGILFSMTRLPQYESYSRLLIESDSDNGASRMGGMASLMRTFSIGGFGSSSVDNEILIIDSHSLKKQLVSRLGLNRTYIKRNGLKKTMLYKNSPILLVAPDALFDTLETAFKVRIELENGKANIKATKGLLGKTIGYKKDASLPCSLETLYGTFQIIKTDNYQEDANSVIDVIVQGDELVVKDFEKLLEVGYAAKKSDGVDLSVLDGSKERGRDILNTLMSLYNERRRNRKSECANADVAFLDQRLASLGAELLQVEANLQKFKTDKSLVDVKLEVPVLLKQDVAVDEEMLKLQVEDLTLKSMLEQLNNEEKKYTLIPMSESLGDENAAAVISNYNALIIKRNTMMKSAKDGNVALQQLTSQIDAIRESAIDNVKRLQDQWRIRYDKIKKESNKFKSRIESLPQYEQEYVVLARDRELKNALYMFLIEKRESAMLKQNNTQELGFVFEPAYSAIKPKMTKTYIILGVGFVLALIIGLSSALFFGLRNDRKKTKKND